MNDRCLTVFFVAIVGALALVSAVTRAAPPQQPELVLRDDTTLEVATPNGKVSVIVRKGLERSYAWDSCSLSANMTARPTRWYGSLGIYDPAGRFGPVDALRDKLRACKGISRTVVQEGQIHFADEQSAEQWILRYSKISTTVWTNHGLLAQWRIVPARDQFNFDLWLVCINGQKPTKLAGATDLAIKLIHNEGPTKAVYECAKVTGDVIAETQRTWFEHWRQVDEWNSRSKQQ